MRRTLLACLQAQSRIARGQGAHPVIVNSLPKAGSHLLALDLSKKLGIINTRNHYDLRDLLTVSVNERPAHLGSLKASQLEAVLCKLRKQQAGKFATMHWPYMSDIVGELNSMGYRIVNIVRDPRGILVSDYKYILGLRRHRMHSVLSAVASERDRYELLIDGMDVAGIRTLGHIHTLSEFLGWIHDPAVLTVKYEDLLAGVNGCSMPSRERTLRGLAAWLGVTPPQSYEASAGVSATYRAGKPYGWMEELPEHARQYFESRSGDLIEAYGYRTNPSWSPE